MAKNKNPFSSFSQKNFAYHWLQPVSGLASFRHTPPATFQGIYWETFLFEFIHEENEKKRRKEIKSLKENL